MNLSAPCTSPDELETLECLGGLEGVGQLILQVVTHGLEPRALALVAGAVLGLHEALLAQLPLCDLDVGGEGVDLVEQRCRHGLPGVLTDVVDQVRLVGHGFRQRDDRVDLHVVLGLLAESICRVGEHVTAQDAGDLDADEGDAAEQQDREDPQDGGDHSLSNL